MKNKETVMLRSNTVKRMKFQVLKHRSLTIVVFLTFLISCFVVTTAKNAYALSPTLINFPLTKDKVWKGSTYVGHGNAYDTLRSAMDINLTDGNDEGYTVFAMATGTVVSRNDSNGEIVVKVSSPLVTINGAYIGSWYYCYAHMKNISVSAGSTVQAGQSVGQVSAVGNAEGSHLHVNIVSADYGGNIYSNPGTQYAISPYYVYGFVDASGNDTSYFKRDMQGPAVTEWLIGHVPVSTSPLPGSQLNIVFDNGQVTGAQSGDYIEIGSQVSLTATPLSGYTFDSWVITDRNVITFDSSNPYTFTMPDHEISIEASFKIISNTVVKRWKNVSANVSGAALSMSATLEVDAATVLSLEMPHTVTNPRVFVSTSQGLGNPYSKYYDPPQDVVTTVNGGKRHSYSFSLNNVSELVNDAGQSLQLQAGTVYYYRWMAVINDNLYTSDLYSFTARNPLVTWSDLCTNGGEYSGLFNGVVRWDKSLSMQEVGCFVSTNRDAVRGASRQNHNGCAFRNDTTIKLDSKVTTDAAYGTWVFYKGPTFDTITSFASNTTYYYKFYAYTSDNVETFSEIMPYTPEGDTTKPQIVSASVSNVTRNGYDVNVVATDNVGLKEIWIGTWNDVIGIDAAKWQVAVPNSNGTASFVINISEFDNVQNTTYHTNAVAYDNAGNQSEIIRVGDPYINGILTSVWMTPQTNYSISAGDSITLSFGADQPVDWYKHIIDMNTSIDAGGLVFASSTGGSTSITFNTPGYYKVFMGAWHVSGDMYTDPIYVSVLSSIEIGGSKNFSLMRGETKLLTVTTDPAEYDQSKLIWTSNYPEIVSVNNDGLVTAHHISGNSVSITCKSPDGRVFDTVSLDVVSNIDDEKFVFYVDRVPAPYYTVDGDGLIALIREPGDILNCDIGISFINDVQAYEVEYTVKEGNISLRNDNLVIGESTSVKNVIAAHIYDKYEDGSRGLEMCFPIEITVFKDIGGGTFTLPANLNLLGENAFEGVAAKKYILPTSLTELPQNSLAGIPRGSWIFFNSDTINPFYADEVLGLPSIEGRTEDYVWFDTGSFTYQYYDGDGALANYYYLANQVQYHWSDWTVAVPASGTEYESKTQYRSRSVSTETVYSDWGSWVSNGTTPIDSTDLRDVKTVAHPEQMKTVYTYNHYKYKYTPKNEWRYSYVDNSGNSWSTQGSWEYVESDTPYRQYATVAKDGYDGWRDGSDYPWFNQGTKQVTTAEAYTEYLYRTRTANSVTNYGGWSDWTDSTITGTASLNVETRTVYRIKLYE